MGVNKHKEHVWVVPEDDANRQLANGFYLHSDLDGTRFHICKAAGGWFKVLAEFEQVHAENLRKFTLRHLVLLIDFDERVDERAAKFKGAIPSDVADRVYVLGTRSEPEFLRKNTRRSLEKMGEELAAACASSEPGLWRHELLLHNQRELERLTSAVKPFLFG